MKGLCSVCGANLATWKEVFNEGHHCKPRCPNYIAPRHYVKSETDERIEGSVMCDLMDKPCFVEYEGGTCETYVEYLKEKRGE